MRVKTWIKASFTIAVLCLFGWPLHAWPQSSSQQSGSDPVADAARKAREDKKNAAKPKKVYTEDDVKPATPASSGNPAGTAASGAPAQQRTGGAAPDEDPNGEAAWRKRFKDQHDKLAKAELELDVLQREVQKSQVEYYPDPQKALSEQNNRKEINDKKAKIDAKQQEIAQIKKDLEDMEEQLRKSGGDPGWAR
jgi:predicted RNase H-like nuclease (RuvC/YqgF family)